jgi:hypothetical protein
MLPLLSSVSTSNFNSSLLHTYIHQNIIINHCLEHLPNEMDRTNLYRGKRSLAEALDKTDSMGGALDLEKDKSPAPCSPTAASSKQGKRKRSKTIHGDHTSTEEAPKKLLDSIDHFQHVSQALYDQARHNMRQEISEIGAFASAQLFGLDAKWRRKESDLIEREQVVRRTLEASNERLRLLQEIIGPEVWEMLMDRLEQRQSSNDSTGKQS